MLQNYFKIAWRNLFKNKLFSFINIFGLALGIAVGLLMFLYVQHEWSYDRWIPQSENIYRFYRLWNGGESGQGSTVMPSILAEAVREEFPEIEAVTRFYLSGEVLLTNEDEKSVYVDNVSYTDSLFLATIPLELLQGDPTTAMNDKSSALISAQLAQTVFGRTNVVGEVIRVDDEADYVIKGVLAEPFGESHLNRDLLLARSEFPPYWTGAQCNIYARLHPSTDVDALNAKITKLANYHYTQEYEEEGDKIDPDRLMQWGVQPIEEVHLKSTHLGGYHGNSGSYKAIGILSLLGLIVLIIAGINYTNLSTARGMKRAKEVGIRKVSGATRQQTIIQFLAEAVVQSFVALVVAILLLEALLPFFNDIVQRELATAPVYSLTFLPLLLGFSLLVGILAGSYPALFLSRFRPVVTLKGDVNRKRESNGFRQSLVVVQFALSITLIIFMTFIWRQVNFMTQQELGFNGDQVVVIDLHNEQGIERLTQNPDRIRQLPGVMDASQMARVPGGFVPNYNLRIEGTEGTPAVNTMFTDTHAAGTLDLNVLEGRFFSDDRMQYDTSKAFVVNSTFIKTYQLENPIGHRVQFPGDEEMGSIIGVVEDFHYEGLQNRLEPLIISSRRDMAWFGNLTVKISNENIPATLANLEQAWKQIEPAHPIRYSFLDEDFERLYNNQMRLGRTILYTTILSIFIALLGLFGLATFMAEQRTKEIGIRKVLGATVSNLITLQVRSFVILILVAGLIAVPVGYLLVRNWLQDFAYQTNLGISPFLLAVFGALAIAILTVGAQAWRVSTNNPVKAIQHE